MVKRNIYQQSIRHTHTHSHSCFLSHFGYGSVIIIIILLLLLSVDGSTIKNIREGRVVVVVDRKDDAGSLPRHLYLNIYIT